MKKTMIVLSLLLFIVSSFSVFAIEPSFLLTKSSVEKSSVVPLSIVYTDPSRDSVKRGELISASYDLFFVDDSSKSMFQIYALSFGGKIQFIKNAYYNHPIKKGTNMRLTVNNIDTSKLPNSFCNTNVRLGGYHFICPGLDGSCGTLALPTSTDSSDTIKTVGSIAEQFGWKLDKITSSNIEGVGDSFKLLCDNIQDTCLSKKGQVVEESLCFANEESRRIYSGTTGIDGKCETTIQLIKDCGTNICTNGKCTTRTVEQKLDDGQGCTQDGVCKSGNCIITLCGEKQEVGETCIQNNECISNICQKNLCANSESKEEDTFDDRKKSLTGTSCEASIFCDNGDVLVECLDIDESTNLGTFGKEETCSKKSSMEEVYQPTEICENKFDEFNNGECQFSFDKFFKSKTVLWTGGSILGVIGLIIIVLIATKKPIKRRK